MKTVTIQESLTVSGGCQKAVDKFENSTGFYEIVGLVAGVASVLTFNLPAGPVRILGAVAAGYVGSKVGYTFGAVNYWVDRSVRNTVNSYLKPAL